MMRVIMRAVTMGVAFIFVAVDIFVLGQLAVNGWPVELVYSHGIFTGRDIPLSGSDWTLITIWGVLHGLLVYGVARHWRSRR